MENGQWVSDVTTYRQTGPGWELRQISQRVGEQVEWILSQNNQGLEDLLPDWSIPEWLLEILFWVIAVTFSAWAIWQLTVLLWPYFQRWGLGDSDFVAVGEASAVLGVPVEEWLQRSRLAQQQGDYREACRALYQATLQQLNDSDLIRHQASRTDGEYVSLLDTVPRPQLYQRLLQTHEQLCFGDRPMTASTYEACWQAFQEILAP